MHVCSGSGFFTLFVQFQGPHCFLTYLDDYKKDPNTAVPYLTLSFFDDFLHTKGLVLMRADVVNVLNIQEAKAYVVFNLCYVFKC